MVFSTAVAESDEIWKHLEQMATGNPNDDQRIANVLQEKDVHRLTPKMFVALHRAKVTGCQFRTWSIRNHSAVAGNDDGLAEDVAFGTLELQLDTSRQRLPRFKLGILDARHVGSTKEVAALAQWVVVDRLAMLTGFFSPRQELMTELATMTGSVFQMPLYQELCTVGCTDGRSRGWRCLMHPSYFLLFGLFRAIRWPSERTVLPDNFQLGDDVWDDMIPLDSIPYWRWNDLGSAFVPNHGNVKMKPVDFERWFSHSFQTCVWLGTATPSHKSQQKAAKGKPKRPDGWHDDRSRGNKWQGWQEWPDGWHGDRSRGNE